MVSIIVSERDRFRFARESLLSVLAHLEGASEIIYVTGRPPVELLSFLEKIRAKRKDFKLVVQNRYLGSNEARRIGLSLAKPGNDVVFVDNDVIVKKGWLTGMALCAKRTGAVVVMPIIFEGGPGSECHLVHDAGSFLLGEGAGMRLEYVFRGLETDWKGIKRQFIDVVEMHCLFVRRWVFEKVVLDLRVGEVGHPFDFSLECKRQGLKMAVEPSAHALFTNTTFFPDSSLEDLRFFLFKFDGMKCRASISYFCEKWGVNRRSAIAREKRSWPMAYKGAIFSSFGVLNGFELLLWRIARLGIFPDWTKWLLEKYMAARIFTGARNRLKWADSLEPLAKG